LEHGVHMMIRPLVAFLLFAACSSIDPIDEEQYLHSLTVDPSGNPVGLVIKPGPLKLNEGKTLSFEDQVKWAKKKKVLLFIHGGLNSIGDGLARTARLVPAIVDDTKGETYPILINWRSGVVSGYTHHLWKYHNGKDGNRFWRAVASPFVFIADLGRAVARLPIVYWEQGSAAFSRASGTTKVAELDPEVSKLWGERVQIDGRKPQWSTSTKIWDGVSQVLPGIVRIVTTPLIDTIGFEGYDMLLRRVETIFFRNDDLNARFRKSDDPNVRKGEPSGALIQLMRHIPADTEIVLIGHSMGTIALNELIRRYPDRNFSTIVYMGAACTIKDFMDTVPDYLSHNLERNPDTKFFNLCLHPTADEGEVSAWSTVPNGSLLEWLDAYLLAPRTPLHRTLGKWNNAVRMLHLFSGMPPEVLNAIHMKAFTVLGDEYPSTHGSFDEFKFWQPAFWDPKLPAPVETLEQVQKRLPRKP